MKTKRICLTILLLLAFSVTADSAYWESTVTQVGTLSPSQGSGYGRLLFKFDLPEQLNGVTVDYAELRFTATPDTASGYICLMGAFPVTKSWETGTLSWSEGWTEAGGDYADTIYSTGVIRTSTDRLSRMDITDVVQMWVDSTLVNYGVMVMPLEDSGRFMKVHTGVNLPPSVKAKVRIFYTREAEE